MRKLDLNVALRIRSQRESNGYSRNFLESLTGISARFLFDIENAKKDMSTATLMRLCEAFDVSRSVNTQTERLSADTPIFYA